MAGVPRTRAILVCALAGAAAFGLLAPIAGARAAPVSTTHRLRVSAARRLHVTLTLRPRDAAALAAEVRAVSTPGSSQYGHYLTPAQFGRRFGAAPRRIDAIIAALRARGLHPGHPSAGGLSIPLAATAGALARGLSLAPSARGSDAIAAAAPALPRGVQSVLGLTGSPAAEPLAVRSADDARGARPRARAGARAMTAAGPQPCAAATAAAPAQSAYTDNQVAAAYGFDPLYGAGENGTGTTIAVYELEPDDPADIAAFQACFDTHTSISYVPVDGGVGVGAGSDEAAFDIENLIGFAPGARLLVYQGPNSNSGLPGSGPYDTFSAIINQDRAQVISVSWGQCEAQLGRPAAVAESVLFEQAAVQGQSIVAAGGDNGAEDCDTGGQHSSARPAVDDPASQPDVTGVGGTTLQSATDPPRETVWNSGDTPGGAAGAGGGGISSLWAMAADQLDAPTRLRVRNPLNTGAACGDGGGACREVPDVSADADPSTGYEVYWNGADTVPEPSGWQGLGGTSGAAPVWAALLAIADASPACQRSPLGFAGPALYRAAADHYVQDFHDVTEGDNDFIDAADGRWPAAAGYDLASGLGTPDAGPLVATLCADTTRLNPLAGQSSAVRASVALRLRGTDVRGAGLTYSASHLPPGVHLDARTGRLSGRPRTPGRYHVRADARDEQGAQAAQRFTWVVGGAPHVSEARLTGSGARRRLELVVRSGAHVPLLRKLVITLPAGLRTGRGSRISVIDAGTSERSTVRVAPSTVSIVPPTPTATVRVTIPVSEVPSSAGRPGTRSATLVAVAAQTGSTGTSSLRQTIGGASR